jgi:glycine cleavage system transcriptional repressor
MQYVLSVMSDDHPGIVAGVSSIVDRLGGNILSCSQTVLDGYFTFITVVDLPNTITPDNLAQDVRSSPELGEDYQVIARYYEPQRQTTVSADNVFIITAFGKDRPGIVREFSRYLAGHDINITDLYGGRRDDDFVLIAQLTIPSKVNIRSIQSDLEVTGKEYGFTVKVQHNNIFVATNQLRLTE